VRLAEAVPDEAESLNAAAHVEAEMRTEVVVVATVRLALVVPDGTATFEWAAPVGAVRSFGLAAAVLVGVGM